MLANVLVDPRFSSFLRPDDPAKTVACIPIVSKGYTLGAIYLASHRTNAFVRVQLRVEHVLTPNALQDLASADDDPQSSQWSSGHLHLDRGLVQEAAEG